MKEKKSDYLLIKIIAAVILGIIIGYIIKSTSGVSEGGSMSTQHVLMNIVLPIKHILGQVIFFMVPLIIIYLLIHHQFLLLHFLWQQAIL